MTSSGPLRAALGVLAAVLAVLTIHQGMIGLLHAIGWLPRGPYQLGPTGPLRVPVLVNLCFWGGLYGLAYGLALPRLPRAPAWLLGLGLGLVAVLVGWFVVAPSRGQPMAGGFVPWRMMISLLINLPWGVATALILQGLLRWRAAAA